MKFEDIARARSTSLMITRLETDLSDLAEVDDLAAVVVEVNEHRMAYSPDIETLRGLIRAEISRLWKELIALGVEDPTKEDAA